MKTVIRTNFPEFVDALAKAPQALAVEVDKALGRGAIEVADQTKLNAPKYRTELTNSIRPTRVSLIEHMVAARNKAYGVYVEGGTRGGGVVPMHEMLNWVKRKGIQPRTPGMSLVSLAALIRRRIANRGSKAQPFMEPALVQKQPRLEELMRGAAVRALEVLKVPAP